MGFFDSLFKSHKVRVRFAPSPTGPLHIGSARTTLFNYLFAKKNKGKFVLRIEDTDLERSHPKYEKEIIESLRWLGLEWDEGVDKGGEYAPYRQTERTEIYRRYLEKLLREKKAFWCPHDKDYLEYEAALATKSGKAPRHICEFRDKKLKPEGKEGIIRLKVSEGRKIFFNDLIHGKISFNSSDLGGDFSLAKDLNTPLYNFAAVVDDYEMDITHVIRGEDHIPNTPKQILIYEVLGFPLPQFAHIPLILGPDRSKLSKRHAVVSIESYKEEGYLPQALISFMALLGWHPEGDREIFNLKELARAFDLSRVQKSGAVFDIEKLDWLNGYYIRNLNEDDFLKKSEPFLKKAGIETEKLDRNFLGKVLELERPRIKKLKELSEKTGYFFKAPDFNLELLIWKDMQFKDVFTALSLARETLEKIDADDWSKEHLKKKLIEVALEAKNKDKGRLLWPLRVALTGLKASPSPFEVLEIFGKNEGLKRIRIVLEKLS